MSCCQTMAVGARSGEAPDIEEERLRAASWASDNDTLYLQAWLVF